MINVSLRRIHEGKPVEIWGDGSVVRDYIYVGDIGESFLKAVETKATNEVFNIGSGKGTSLLEVLASFEQVLGLRPQVIFKPGRPFDVPCNILDIKKAAEMLGWRPTTPFEEGLRRTWDWIKRG